MNLLHAGNYLHCIYNHLHGIYIVLGTINNLEIIRSIQKDICRLYANCMPFYIRDLSILGFWYLWGVLEAIPHGYKGTTVVTESNRPTHYLAIFIKIDLRQGFAEF